MRKKRFTSQWLASASALAFIFGATATGTHAQTSTYTVSNETISQINLNSSYLGNSILSNLPSLSTGNYTYNYVVVSFTPTTTVTSSIFGVYQANFDTVAILYSGSFDPLNPSANATAGNDDNSSLIATAGVTTTGCGSVCSAFSTSLTAGQTYYLFLSTYSSGTNFTLPVSFFATGTDFTWTTVPSTATPTSTDIDTAAAGGYDASLLGSNLNAVFAGGTLYFTTNNQQFSQNFTLGNSASNTINISGLTTLFSGNFSDQSTNGSLVFTNSGTGGSVTLSGANTYTGSTTIDNNANVELTGTISNTSGVIINSGGTLTIGNGGALTSDGVSNNANGHLIIAQGGTLTDDLDNSGTVDNSGISNAIVNTNTGTLTNLATGVWNGAVASNTGTLTNAGTWNGNITTSGTLTNTGTLNGNLTNSGTTNASGTLTGDISNSGNFKVTGDLSASGSLTNSGAGMLWVNGGDLTSLTSLTNSSTANVGVQVDAGRTLSLTSGSAGTVALTNASGASLINNGTISLANGLSVANSGTVQIGTTGTLLAPGGITNTSSGLITVLTGGSVTDDLDNAGTVNNAGTFNAIVNTNTGTLTNLATGIWNGAVASNTGTLTNAGTWNGNITTSGTLTNTGTLNGALTVTGGQLVTTGTITGGLTNTANAWAQGILNGAVVNNGTLTLTGTLSNDGSAFSNSGNLIIGGNTYSGVGAFTNASGGTVAIGTSTTNGHLSLASLSNAGAVNMMNGRTGDSVIVSGAYTGAAGSVLSFDIDLSKGTADKLVVGTLNGQSTVRLNNTATTKRYLYSPLVLVSSNGGTGTLTTGTDAGTTQALASDSLVSYSFRQLQNSSDWGIVSTLNTSALGNLAASLTTFTTAQSLSLAKLPEEVFAYEDTYGVNQWMASSWAEAYSGDMTASSDVSISDAYSSGTKTKIYSSQNGVQYGFGAGIYNINGTGMNLHAGFMGGSTDAKAQDKTLTGSNTRFDVPHYGYYAALTHQGVRLTVQDRFDVLRMNLTNPALSLSSSQLKGSSETLSIGLSKHYTIKNVFIEPTINYTNTKINVHTLTLADNMGSVHLSDIKSHLLRLGARFGTTLTTKSVTWKPYGELSALNETAPDTQTAYLPEGGTDPIWVTGKHGGSFAQLTAGVQAQSRSNPNLSGYVSADVRQGRNIGGWSLRSGVSYRFN